MKSINQINARLQNNPTIRYYLENSGAYDNNYRNRSFDFIFPSSHEDNRKARVSPFGTFIYRACEKELARVTGHQHTYNYDRDNKRVTHKIEAYGKEYYFDVIAKLDIQGVTLWIYNTNFLPLQQFKPVYVRSNDSWADFDILAYFQRVILPRYLYSEGMMRNIQLYYNCHKNEVAEKYKNLCRVSKLPSEYDEEKAYRQLFKKRFNVLLAEPFNTSKLNYMLNTFTWQKKRVKIVNAVSIFELYDELSQEYDTDEGIMQGAEEYLSEVPANTIMI